MTSYGDLSLWFEQLAASSLEPRPPLRHDVEVDVAIVGAGFTGLWTAYYLQELDPGLRIALVESQIAGYGASGRNGGWCSALFPVGAATLAREAGREGAIAQYRATRQSVDEVVRVAAAEGIDADIAHGGTIVVARTEAQLARARDEAAQAAEYDLDIALLDAEAARAHLNATDVVGATFTAHCAAIQPAKLVRGLADAVERRGATIYERSPVTDLSPHAVRTACATVRASTIVRATEGYTARLPGLRRALVPVYSLIIATEPLPDSTWDEIGLAHRETFADHRNLIVYGQRSADGRLVFGGRGAPYHWGSRVDPRFDREPAVFDALERTVHELFPVLRAARVTHRWGGPLGIARDWHASVGLDAGSGMAWAGGYVGDGVSTTNLAGRTLADLITGRRTDLTTLPWVGHRSRAWEPEPLRWLGANLGLQAMTWADRAEQDGRHPSRVVGLVNAMMGR